MQDCGKPCWLDEVVPAPSDHSLSRRAYCILASLFRDNHLGGVFVPELSGARVLHQPVEFTDQAQSTPIEIHPCDSPAIAMQPDLKLRDFEAKFMHERAAVRLPDGFRTGICEIYDRNHPSSRGGRSQPNRQADEGLSASLHGWTAAATSQDPIGQND